MIKIKINNKIVYALANTTVIQLCFQLKIEITKFCYHSAFSIAGNCRICLVEISRFPKLLAACAMPLSANINIYTNSPIVQKARESVIEFLLLHHPLDCPICDQGGECDLQDQASFFGSGQSRYFQIKKTQENINFGPLIKTVISRCILCTRCVRFSFESVGIKTFSVVGRGLASEIGFYTNNIFQPGIISNVIDICPVGALTSKTMAFEARPWELKKRKTIDFFHVLGPMDIYLYIRDSKVIKVLPKKQKNSSPWISDVTRFSIEILTEQRLSHPFFKFSYGFAPVSWQESVHLLKKQYKRCKIQIRVNTSKDFNLDINEMFTLTTFIKYRSNTLLQIKNAFFPLDQPTAFAFKGGFSKFTSFKNIFLFGINQYENPLLESKLRSLFLIKSIRVFSLGSYIANLSIPVFNLGITMDIFNLFVLGKLKICKLFSNKKKCLVFVGSSFIQRKDKIVLNSIMLQIIIILKHQNVLFKIFFLTAVKDNSIGVAKFGRFRTINRDTFFKPSINVFLGTKTFIKHNKKSFNVYIGTHLPTDSKVVFNLLLPVSTFLEKKTLFIGNDGQTIDTKSPVFIPSRHVKTLSSVFKYLFTVLKINKENEMVISPKSMVPTLYENQKELNYLNSDYFIGKLSYKINNVSFKITNFDSFLKNNQILSFSPTLVNCAKVLKKTTLNFKKLK